jgi:hypothetical protein
MIAPENPLPPIPPDSGSHVSRRTTEEPMTELAIAPLPELLRILWSARADVTCNRWHLVNRTIPRLDAMATESGDAHLRKAVDHTTAAVEHMDALLKELRTAVDLLQPGGARST